MEREITLGNRVSTRDRKGTREDLSQQSAREVVPLVMALVRPRRVVDLGCGKGIWLAVFAEHGVDEILGVDGDWQKREESRIPPERFMARDLREPFRVDREFDLAVSLEVAEHLPAHAAATVVDSLVGLSPVVLFSAAIPFQGGWHHVNEQWPDYWVRLFDERGYVLVDCIRQRIWDNAKVIWWYAQNMLLFVRRDRLSEYPALVKELDRASAFPLAVVHPEKYLRIADPQNLTLRQASGALLVALRNAAGRRVKPSRRRKSPR